MSKKLDSLILVLLLIVAALCFLLLWGIWDKAQPIDGDKNVFMPHPSVTAIATVIPVPTMPVKDDNGTHKNNDQKDRVVVVTPAPTRAPVTPTAAPNLRLPNPSKMHIPTVPAVPAIPYR